MRELEEGRALTSERIAGLRKKHRCILIRDMMHSSSLSPSSFEYVAPSAISPSFPVQAENPPQDDEKTMPSTHNARLSLPIPALVEPGTAQFASCYGATNVTESTGETKEQDLKEAKQGRLGTFVHTHTGTICFYFTQSHAYQCDLIRRRAWPFCATQE